jgi:Flp pilus assembly protein TadG
MFFSTRQIAMARVQRSQSMVEFAMSSVLLLILVSGLLDLGRMYFVYTAVADAAGEGALYLSVNPGCYSPLVAGCLDPNNVQYRMQAAGGKLVELHNAAVRIEFITANPCVYYTQSSSGTGMPVALTLDTAKSPNWAANCDAANVYVYQTGDDVSVQVTYPYVLLTPVISRMVPLYNGQNALPLNVFAVQPIIVK